MRSQGNSRTCKENHKKRKENHKKSKENNKKERKTKIPSCTTLFPSGRKVDLSVHMRKPVPQRIPKDCDAILFRKKKTETNYDSSTP